MKRAISWVIAILFSMAILPCGAFAQEVDGTAAIPETAAVVTANEEATFAETKSTTEMEAECIPSNAVEIAYNKDADPAELSIKGTNIALDNGTYSYELVVNAKGDLTFENDLDILYQGVDGKYKLHYAMDETENHIMVVDGEFDNILVESPLLKKSVRSKISEDTYSYNLNLRTEEGFTFTNSLKYLFNGNKHGYSLNYSYDLLTDSQTLEISRGQKQSVSFDVPTKPTTTRVPAFKSIRTWR